MKKIKKIAYTSLFTALICASAFICIPTAPPFTMQTFAIFLSLLILGASKAFCAILIYVCIGLLGLPVFSAVQGGIGTLLNPGGGFIIGFLLMPAAFAVTLNLFKLKPFYSCIASLLPLYTAGVIWFIFISGAGFSINTVCTAILTCVIPFIIPDILKLTLALFVQKRIKGWIKL